MTSNQIITRYERVFDNQIRLVNNIHSKLRTLVNQYYTQKQSLADNYLVQIKIIKKSYERQWWEYIIPVKKLKIGEFRILNNQVTLEYNSKIRELDASLNSQVIQFYRQGFDSLINLMNNTD